MYQPTPLTPTVIVQDQDENVVERVEAPPWQRFMHHVDIIWLPLARRTGGFVRSTKFEVFIIVCILLNTVILAIEHPFMDPALELSLCIVNLVSSENKPL